MGYYGLGPGMKVPDQLSAYEKSLRSLPLATAYQTLDIIEKLLKNVAQNPKEEKFRKVKLDNPKISAAITSLQPALQAFLELGFLYTAEGSPFLTLPATKNISFPDHVAKVIDAKDWYKKEIEKDRVAKGLSRVAPADSKSGYDDRRSEAEIAALGARNVAWLAGSRVEL